MLFGEHTPAILRPSRALQHSLFSLLQTCNTTNKLTQIHSQIIINGLSNKNSILAKLFSLYISSGHLQNALSAFKNIEKPSINLWNQIIRCHSRGKNPYKSFQLFKKMVADEITPDGYTYSFVISACARNGLLREGKQVHGRVISNGFCSDLFIRTNLINFYSVNGEGIGDACKVFEEMTERNTVAWNALLSGYIKRKNIDEAIKVFENIPKKSVVSWTAIISGCAENGRCKQAISLFQEMRRENIEFDQVAMLAALSACAELGDLELGMWIHSYTLEYFLFKNQGVKVSLNNALIHMYASCGMIEEAYKIFLGMTKKTIVSWTSMITGYAKQGRGDEALRTFYWMLCEPNIIPDDITFLGVLSACSHSGFVNEGREIFEKMSKNWGIVPKIEHYGCYIDLLSRAGFLEEARRVVESMPIEPNNAILGAILGGCMIHKNMELGSIISRKLMVEIDCDRAVNYMVLVSNMYATGMRWKDVADMRERVVEMGVKKPPGRSCVQIEGVIHEFYAYDMNHEYGFLIYKVLGEIYAHARGEENVLDFPENFEVSNDVQTLWL